MEDEPVYKPRQTRGTPAFRYSYKLGAAFGVGCFAIHFIYAYFNKDRLYRKIASGLYDSTEHIKKRRKIMGSLNPIPSSRNAPILEYEDYTSSIDNDADNTLDVDLR